MDLEIKVPKENNNKERKKLAFRGKTGVCKHHQYTFFHVNYMQSTVIESVLKKNSL